MSEKPKLEIVKESLAELLGIETDDISYDDSLRDDLHMRATDITDLLEILNTKGIEISKLELSDIQTFEDLVRGLDVEDQL